MSTLFFVFFKKFFDCFHCMGNTTIMLNFKSIRPQDVGVHPLPDPEYNFPVTPENTEKLFQGCEDFTFRRVLVGPKKIPVLVCWLDGTVNGAAVAEQVLRPLTNDARFAESGIEENVISLIQRGLVYADDMKTVSTMDELAESISFGHCALVFSGKAIVFELRSTLHRSVQEPSVEKSIKGSKDAFVEPLRINTGLVRSRLRTPRLKLHQVILGRKSRTAAAVMWLDGVTAPDLPQEMIRRLQSYDVDGAVLPDLLESALIDAPRSPFPQLVHTERPDKFAASLLDGRVGLLVDGIPIGYLAPSSLPAFMRTNEDLALHFLSASAIRILRWLAFAITLLLPAFYVAIAMYHAEMIPIKLLLSVIDSKQYVPFSSAAEILGMLIAFELLQEAGLHLPDPVGQTVSIIGALIVGQSAVEAKVISPIAVIVVALAGIAGYTLPSQDLGTALRLCRFGLVIAAAVGGMFGIVVGTALLLWHLCSLESFGRPYMTTLSGSGDAGSRAVLFRRPPWKDIYRDPAITGWDKRMRK